MPSKNSKQVVQKTETPETKVATSTPVVESAAPKQKGGKKVEAVAAPVVEAPKQKGGKKAAATPAAAPVKEVAKVEAAATKEAPAQKGGKKAAATPAAAPAKEAVAPKQKGGKKAAATPADAPAKEASKQKGGKKAAVKKEEAAEDAEEGEGDRRIRSFKVRLPNKEEFEGRFTGLTPYQAANKALSKYYRETETPMVEVTFSICESTRKSKKSVYTYVGKRLKLEVPVTYQIQDGRQIVKNFKNSLKKVKKSESSA